MAFNVGITSKDAFKQLKQLSPRKRVDAVSGPNGVSMLSMLTPVEFAELFPNYYKRGLPDVGGFREAVSRMSRQKQDDINFGLSQGAKSLQEAEQMGSWRRRLGGDQQPNETVSNAAYSRGGSLKSIIDKAAAKYGIDPRVMYGIVAGESGHGDRYDKNENLRTQDLSYGPFQMNILKSGMEGDRFQKATGLSVKDPSSLQAQADWVARRISEMRSDPSKIHAVWHGYKGNVDWNPRWGSMGAGPATPVPVGSEKMGSAPDFSQHAMFKGVNNYNGKCGVGTRTFAGHMFGNKYFLEKGIGTGGDEHAGSLSNGNNYFQSSGMFRAGKPVSKDALTQDYLNSLPIGTVVSSQGGSRGGHVQIKIGPNQWASDTVQSGFFYGNSYSNFVVHQPNEAGLAALANNGVIQGGGLNASVATAVTAAQAQQEAAAVTPQKTVAAAAPAPTQPELPQEVPDAQTGGQTAKVNKPEKKAAADRTFTINKQQLIEAIKQTDEFKNTIGSSFASDDMIYSGFLSHEKTQKLMAETKSSYDASTNTVKIGNYDKFQKNIGMDTSKILTEVASNVPSHAGGGRERVKGPLHMHHLHHQRRGDTALVTDARGKRFTVNPQKETMTVDPNTNIMDIKPIKTSNQMDLEKLMAIVRRQETGSFEGNYQSDLAAKKYKKGQRHNTASGAYQYNNRTWKGVLEKELNMPHILKQYPRAVDAPKHIQDMVTQKRFQKFRDRGYSDNEIILHHFTGNRAGKLSASAQKGNPTPAQYRAQIASHASEYDKMYKPTAFAKDEKPMASTPTAAATVTTPSSTPVTQEASTTDKMKSLISPLIGPPAAVAAPKKEEPQPTGAIDTAPSDFVMPAATTPPTAKSDQHSMLMEKPQNPVSINPLEQRPAHMQPTPSMARAMDNARGVVSTSYTSLTNTNLG